MSKETDIDCLLKSIDYNLTDWARAEFHKWLRKKDKKIADLEAKLAEYKQHTKIALEDFNEIQNENDKLAHQLAEKDRAIENWQTMYQSVVQTCYNDKEEIERLNKRLETQENTITNLVEDNRASQEWYKKQLEEKEDRIKWLVEAEWNRKWANKYIEMRRKEDSKLLFPDSDEVYERYFEQKEYIEKLEADLDQAFNLDDIYAEKLRKRHEDYEKMKISFTVEQLEKVKEETKEYFYEMLDSEKIILERDFLKVLDNQIAELTHQHEDKGE